ncbi:unnamed protein product [marine sediment metagenome]|uniref:Histidine kinase domain-containing protein n=1 Tax=marine sediment metagenome TaxID=412755 RepID=X0TSN8_9ZZZZ
MVESIRDLTQKVQFTHQQRLSELGRLAAGVAHEIYNPLSCMKLALGSLANMIEVEKQPDDFGNCLDIVEREMDQCIQITDRLLHLSAVPTGQLMLVDFQRAIEDTLSLVKWEAEQASIEVIVSFPKQPLRIFASESEIRMLILNLVQNAFHAMPSGGRLKITGSLEDSKVVMSFEDNGVGVPAENLSKLFTPFFSRRADGVHGTGLGLPISRTIVEACDGTLEVESELGKGSSFIVSIPEASIERFTS